MLRLGDSQESCYGTHPPADVAKDTIGDLDDMANPLP